MRAPIWYIQRMKWLYYECGWPNFKWARLIGYFANFRIRRFLALLITLQRFFIDRVYIWKNPALTKSNVCVGLEHYGMHASEMTDPNVLPWCQKDNLCYHCKIPSIKRISAALHCHSLYLASLREHDLCFYIPIPSNTTYQMFISLVNVKEVWKLINFIEHKYLKNSLI